MNATACTRNRAVAAVLRCATLAVALLAVGPAHATLPDAVDGEPLPSLAPMVERTTPGVVNIATLERVAVQDHPLLRDPFFRRFFEGHGAPRERHNQSLGSGVIVDAQAGHILTNHHVIRRAEQIRVTLADGRELEAEVIGTDEPTDLAVIRVDADNLAELPAADSDALRVGDFVVAIGNPFGLGQTVTSGIVSALGRSGLRVGGNHEDFIQTDASINPGNSGGALVNLRGELVGINTAILSPGREGNVGIGFAIPVNLAREVLDQLVEHGEVRRGQLGFSVRGVTRDLAAAYDLGRDEGVLVTRVAPDSPAAEADLRAGDIILAVDGEPIEGVRPLRRAFGLLPVGESFHLALQRDDRELETTITIAPR